MLPKPAPYAGDCTACAGSGNKNINLPVGITPNLLCCRAAVRLRVGRIGKLTGQKCTGNFFGKLLRLRNGSAHSLCSLGQDHLCAERGGKAAALHTHGIRHGQNHAIAPRGRYKRQTHAGISARRLHNGSALFEQAAAFRILNHSQCDAILG